MSFEDLIKKRRSIHNFESGFKLSDEEFEKIIEITRFAPSGYNAQPWRFVLVRSEEQIKKIGEIAFGQSQVVEAGNAILVLGDLEIGRNADELLKDWVAHGYCTEEKVPTYKHTFTKQRDPGRKKQMSLRNASFAAASLLYVLEDLGYHACPMMGFSQPKMEKLLNIPEDYIPILLVAVGKGIPEKEKTRLPRKDVKDLISYEAF